MRDKSEPVRPGRPTVGCRWEWDSPCTLSYQYKASMGLILSSDQSQHASIALETAEVVSSRFARHC